MSAGIILRSTGTCDASGDPAAERKGAVVPEGSTKKEKRQYEHIKESYQDKGVNADEAKERAARTVNKQKGKKK